MLRLWLQHGLKHFGSQIKSKLNGRKFSVGLYAFAGSLFAMHDEFTKLIEALAEVGITCYPIHPSATRAWFKGRCWNKNWVTFSGEIANMVIGINLAAEHGHSGLYASCRYDLELRYPDGVHIFPVKRETHYCSSSNPLSLVQQSMDEILLKILKAVLREIAHPHELDDYVDILWFDYEWDPEPLTGRAGGYFIYPFSECNPTCDSVEKIIQTIARCDHLPGNPNEELALPDNFQDIFGWSARLRAYFLGRIRSFDSRAEFVCEDGRYKIRISSEESEDLVLLNRLQENQVNRLPVTISM